MPKSTCPSPKAQAKLQRTTTGEPGAGSGLTAPPGVGLPERCGSSVLSVADPWSEGPLLPSARRTRTLGDVLRETRYAKSGEVHIAYQVVGDGPIDLLLIPGLFTHVEHRWEEPSFARFLDRLASFSRLIVVDARGTGLSDRAP